jgi:glycosyltransferase involved in cell wall biosynthesis
MPLITFTDKKSRFYRFLAAVRKNIRTVVKPESGEGRQISPDTLPPWLIDEMRQIHAIEPQIFPTESFLETLPEYTVPDTRLAAPYNNLCRQIGGKGAYIFLVPWLNRGGADRLTLNYVQALRQQCEGANIVVIATTVTRSLWQSRLPPEVTFINFGLDYSYLSIDEQRRLLALLLVQMAPEVIHNINSELGYFVYCLHGKSLRDQSRLIASSFCFDYTREGQRVGYAAGFIPECYDFLTAVFTDNRAHIDHMISLFGFTPDKFIVHYQPSPQITGNRPHPRGENDGVLHILWAGRIARQKRPDILIDIAGMCIEKPYIFHVYGSFDGESKCFESLFADAENIHYHGSFDELVTIDSSGYDLFLYTSQWDGLPNILLEAIALRLPVISSDAGGIGEIILDGKTGVLISPRESIEKYVLALDRFHQDPDFSLKLAEEAVKLLRLQHSWDGFCGAVHNPAS